MSTRRRSLGGAAAWLGDGMQFVNGPGAEATTVTYRVSGSSRASTWILSGVLAAGAAAGFAVPWLMPGDFMVLYAASVGILVCGALALWLARVAWGLGVRIRVEPDHLLRIGPGTAVRSVAWEDVARVRERPLLERLDIVDRRGRRVMSLEYRLDGFLDLAERVGRRVAREEMERQDPIRGRGTVFPRTRADRLAPLVGAALLVAGSVAFFGGVLLAAWVGSAFCLVAWLLRWSRVRVERGQVVVEWPFRRRRIPAQRLADVRLLLGAGSGGRGTPTVSLLLDDGSHVVLDGAGAGGVVLHAALRRLLSAGREEEES